MSRGGEQLANGGEQLTRDWIALVSLPTAPRIVRDLLAVARTLCGAMENPPRARIA